jgi:Tfp pilus assembly PilM family ATPase
MPQFIALEWDGFEARLAVASGRGDQVVIEQAFSVELRPREPAQDKSEVDIGARLAAALGARRIGRLDTLVAIGRTNIELRQLLLPPAPDEELPDLVRFQAMREFNELNEDWLLDFMSLGNDPNEPRTVLAAAVGPELVQQIQQTCEAAGMKPRRLVLRACAAASLVARSPSARQGELRLLIDLLSDEADLTVISGEQVVFLRTTRLGGDPISPLVLAGEVRRTMAAVQNQLGGRKVESIVLCGENQQQAELAQRLEKELGVPTELFDPFKGLNLSAELRDAPPEHPGRFAPLLGLLLAELEHTGHAVDFLHPRRRQEPPKKWKRLVLPGAVAVVLVLGYLGWGIWERQSIRWEIAEKRAQISELKKKNEESGKTKEIVDEIEKWTATDICWLDELEGLSRKFPPASEAMISKLEVASNQKGVEVTFSGLTRTAATIAEMEKRVNDPARTIEIKGSGEETKVKPYTWQFNGKLKINPSLPPAPAAAEKNGGKK